MPVREASHVEYRNIAVVHLKRKFLIERTEAMVSGQENSFNDVVKVELSEKKVTFNLYSFKQQSKSGLFSRTLKDS